MEGNHTGLLLDYFFIEVYEVEATTVLIEKTGCFAVEVFLSLVLLLDYYAFGGFHGDQFLALELVVFGIYEDLNAFLEYFCGGINGKDFLTGDFSQTVNKRDFCQFDVFSTTCDRFNVLNQIDDISVRCCCPLLFFIFTIEVSRPVISQYLFQGSCEIAPLLVRVLH